MESIGQILKAARERRQISIADVVVATKMTSAFVKAIEADDFNALVAPIYARGFIKLYAQCVGLDPMPLLKQFGVSRRAAPVLIPLPPKAPSRGAAVAYTEKMQPKPDQKKVGSRSKAIGGAALASAAPLRVGMQVPMANRLPSWLAALLAGRLSALSRLFGACAQWPWFNLPGSVSQYFQLPALVWRRIFIVAGVVLLIIAASLAWEWSHSGLPSTTDACWWLAEPPAPYLTMETRAVPPMKTPNIQRPTSNVE